MIKYSMLNYLNNNSLLVILFIISVGYLVGSIKIKGVSLGSSAILFVGIYAGMHGISIPIIIKTLGLSLFIYSIGLQAGPKLRSLFKKESLKLEILAILIIFSASILTILGIFVFHFDKNLSIGIFAGALTSTPGLAAAYEATGSNLTSIGYGISYPIGVIGVIIFLKIVQLFSDKKIKSSEKEEIIKKEEYIRTVTFKQILVENKGVVGKSLKELKIPESFNCIISRIITKDKVLIPTKDSVLYVGDIVRIVGKTDDIERTSIFLGKFIDKKIPDSNLTAMRFIITNKELVGKTIEDLKLKCSYNATITRITRAGIDIPATKKIKLEWGDRIIVVGEQNSFEYFKKLFGDNVKKVNEVNVFSIILGLALGIIIGIIPVSFGNILSFKLGITGGILLSSLILSNIGKLGPILWRAPYNIIVFIREIGLVFFLTSVGCSAGSNFTKVLESNGVGIIVWGFFITFIPMIIVFYLSNLFNINVLKLLGLIPAGMTSTPGFAAATSITESETPSSTYATVYPVAMLSMIIFAKLLAIIL
jgi:putative transport protein